MVVNKQSEGININAQNKGNKKNTDTESKKKKGKMLCYKHVLKSLSNGLKIEFDH